MTQVYIVAKATIKAFKLVKEGNDDFTVESDALGRHHDYRKLVNVTLKEFKASKHLKFSIATIDKEEAKAHFLRQQAELAEMYRAMEDTMENDLASGKELLGIELHSTRDTALLPQSAPVEPPWVTPESKKQADVYAECRDLAIKMSSILFCLKTIAEISKDKTTRNLAISGLKDNSFDLLDVFDLLSRRGIRTKKNKKNKSANKPTASTPTMVKVERPRSDKLETVSTPASKPIVKPKRGPNVLTLVYLIHQVALTFKFVDAPPELKRLKDAIAQGMCNLHTPGIIEDAVSVFHLAYEFSGNKSLTIKMVENLRLVAGDIKEHDTMANRKYKDPALEQFINAIKDKGWY